MACVTKRRGKWVLDFRDRQGRRRWESFDTRKEADLALSERLQQLKRGNYVAPGKEKTFSELCESFTAAHKPHVKENTWTDYGRNLRLHLKPFFDGYKLPEITVSDVERFVSEKLERGIGTRTVNKCLTLLSSVFKYAGKHGWMHSNPATHVKKQKTRDADPRDEVTGSILSPVEFRAVLEKAKPPWRLIVKTAGLTGLRQGELLGLKWKNVDLNLGEVHVREQYTAGRWSSLKSKSARRTVPLPSELISDLRKHKLSSGWKEAEDLVFATSAGGPHNHSNLTNRGWRPALRRAKLRERSFHSLRHTYTSALICNNVGMKVISYLCGHSSITITMDVYGHLLPDATNGVAEALAETMLGKSGSKMVAERSQDAGRGDSDRAQVIEISDIGPGSSVGRAAD